MKYRSGACIERLVVHRPPLLDRIHSPPKRRVVIYYRCRYQWSELRRGQQHLGSRPCQLNLMSVIRWFEVRNHSSILACLGPMVKQGTRLSRYPYLVYVRPFQEKSEAHSDEKNLANVHTGPDTTSSLRSTATVTERSEPTTEGAGSRARDICIPQRPVKSSTWCLVVAWNPIVMESNIGSHCYVPVHLDVNATSSKTLFLTSYLL